MEAEVHARQTGGVLDGSSPGTDDPQRHALVMFGVPAFAVLFSVVYALFMGAILGTAISIFTGVVGAPARWAGITYLRKRRHLASGNEYL
jgi:hypothetical protein